MGIIARQSIYNTISIFFAFAIGAINTLFLYPGILNEKLYGLITTLLAFSNIIQPVLSFGVQHTLIKFYSSCNSRQEKDSLLIFSIITPLFLIIPVSIVFLYNYESIALYLSSQNSLIYNYIFLILLISISTAYFEIFYSWLKIKKKTVLGNFLKEVYPRSLQFILLLIYFFEIIDFNGFTYLLIAGYYLRMVLIMGIAFINNKIQVNYFKISKEWIKYSGYIFLSAFAASVIIDIDKSMISKFLLIENVAYYTVAIFIAAIIDIPGRAMFQIINPLVSEALSQNKYERLEELLKKSSLNLLIISGFIFLLITVNIEDIYRLIKDINGIGGYSIAIPVVLVISVSKLFSASLGCINNIITNSKYYQYILLFSIGSALSAFGLNIYFIINYGIIGAAYATLIVIFIFNILKILLVSIKFNITPYSTNVFKTIILIISIYFILSMIKINDYSAISVIIIKSISILVIYISLCYYLNLSREIKVILKKILIKTGLLREK